MRTWLGALLALFVPLHAGAVETEPYGVPVNTTIPEKAAHSIVREWNQVQAKLSADAKVIDDCMHDAANCPAEAVPLVLLVERARAAEGVARLRVVHEGVDEAIAYVSDKTQWGTVERWSNPLETFRTRKGDCEDYVLAKYLILLLAGTPPAHMRLLVEQQHNRKSGAALDELHIVLAAEDGEEWYVLDNAEPSVARALERPMRFIEPRFALDWRETPIALTLRQEATAH